MPLEQFAGLRNLKLNDEVRADIDAKVRGAAYRIIRGKTATYYGIGAALARVVEAILNDQRAVLTVCAPAAEAAGVRDVTLSLPRLVGGKGVLAAFPPPLSDEENAGLTASARVIRAALDEL
jgi:L-lactate dehydrogenase